MKFILILEDDHDLVVAWKRALVDEGYRVDVAHRSADAVALAENNSYDLFVVDLVLSNPSEVNPDSGRDFLRYAMLQVNKPMPAHRFIGVTGFRPTDRDRVPRSIYQIYGVKNVLFKPFQPSELVSLVKAQIG